MTLGTSTRVVSYVGNGVTTVFPYTFRVDQATDLKVALREVATGVTAEPMSAALYSVTGIGDDAGGNVTYPLSGDPLPEGYKIVIYRKVPYTQDTDVSNQTTLYLSALENQLDRLTMQTIQLAEKLDRAFTYAEGYDGDVLTSEQLLALVEVAPGTEATYITRTADFTVDAAELIANFIVVNSAGAVVATLPSTASVMSSVLCVVIGSGTFEFAIDGGAGSLENKYGWFAAEGQWSVVSATVITNTGGSNAVWLVTGDVSP